MHGGVGTEMWAVRSAIGLTAAVHSDRAVLSCASGVVGFVAETEETSISEEVCLRGVDFAGALREEH